MRGLLPQVYKFRLVVAAAMLGVLAGCSNSGGFGSSQRGSAFVGKADYSTYTEHFKALQTAGLDADYNAFAQHLNSSEPQGVVARLQQNFSGRPFDVYTAKSQTSSTDHKRIVELRGTGGRLYLFVELAKVPGGWTVADYDLNRSRNSIITLL